MARYGVCRCRLKGPDIYMIVGGLQFEATSISSKQRGAISGLPLPERTD